jgi:hypothetical protein
MGLATAQAMRFQPRRKIDMIKRWMAEITYRKPLIQQFEELYELHDIVEHGPDWNEIDQIIVTLNRSSATLTRRKVIKRINK